LDSELRLKSKPNIRFAGQITGCEGYVESAATGLIAARFAAAELQGGQVPAPPVETAIGALLAHITGGADAATYQPMNVNFGLMPPPDARVRKADRKKAYTDRARAALAAWLELLPQSSKPTPRDHSTPSDHSTSRRHSSEGWNPDRVRELQ
jgi:methylenetetrahydrofolate--tRNA-(uracil-5-)-methyltransferase